MTNTTRKLQPSATRLHTGEARIHVRRIEGDEVMLLTEWGRKPPNRRRWEMSMHAVLLDDDQTSETVDVPNGHSLWAISRSDWRAAPPQETYIEMGKVS